jgi:outer membrane protein assembly factor BamB
MTPNWVNKLGGSLENMSPALNHAEDVVFVSLKKEAVALHASDGTEKWRVPLASSGFGKTSNFSPSVANDGSAVYFNSKAGLYALDPETGATLWNFVPPHPVGDSKKEEIHVSPAIGQDGTLYFGASKGKESSHYYALNPDGTIRWSHEHTDKGQFKNTQAVIGVDASGNDDLVYVGHGKLLFAFEPHTGALRWTMLVPGKVESGPVLGAPGMLYVGLGARLHKITD